MTKGLDVDVRLGVGWEGSRANRVMPFLRISMIRENTIRRDNAAHRRPRGRRVGRRQWYINNHITINRGG